MWHSLIDIYKWLPILQNKISKYYKDTFRIVLSMYTQNIYRAEHITSSKLGSRIWQGWFEVFESFLLEKTSDVHKVPYLTDSPYIPNFWASLYWVILYEMISAPLKIFFEQTYNWNSPAPISVALQAWRFQFGSLNQIPQGFDFFYLFSSMPQASFIYYKS